MASDTPHPERKSKIIFGIDDARENRILLEAVVKGAGYSFFGMESGKEALITATRIIPRLILLDIQMPDLDGFETCRRLRTMPQLNPVPIAFLTAAKTPADVQMGIAAGGNDFIIKPFDRDQLLRRIEYWTTRRIRPSAAGEEK